MKIFLEEYTIKIEWCFDDNFDLDVKYFYYVPAGKQSQLQEPRTHGLSQKFQQNGRLQSQASSSIKPTQITKNCFPHQVSTSTLLPSHGGHLLKRNKEKSRAGKKQSNSKANRVIKFSAKSQWIYEKSSDKVH